MPCADLSAFGFPGPLVDVADQHNWYSNIQRRKKNYNNPKVWMMENLVKTLGPSTPCLTYRPFVLLLNHIEKPWASGLWRCLHPASATYMVGDQAGQSCKDQQPNHHHLQKPTISRAWNHHGTNIEDHKNTIEIHWITANNQTIIAESSSLGSSIIMRSFSSEKYQKILDARTRKMLNLERAAHGRVNDGLHCGLCPCHDFSARIFTGNDHF